MDSPKFADTRRDYWNRVFGTKEYTGVLWHQTRPDKSLEQVEAFARPDDYVLDVGCGASLLADNLIAEGYQHIWLLDTSETSLDIVKKRLHDKAGIPTYVCADIVDFAPAQQFRVWHDRAMFHFLLDKRDRTRYFEVLMKSLLPAGTAIINTFAADGETECAGLKTLRYDAKTMEAELPEGLSLVGSENFVHTTPKNTRQNYAAFYIRKTPR